MSGSPSRRCRLYLITPPVVADPAAFSAQLDAALRGGDVACLQIRLKDTSGVSASDEQVRDLAARIIRPAQEHGVAVLINDRPDLAVELGADGVHIGQSDATLAAARKLVGPDGVVGVTCHDSRHLALEAGEMGADYVAFGAFYPTSTKATQTQPELDILTWWQDMIELPCVAIGGIQTENARPLVEAGADFLAVSSGVWSFPEGPEAAVRSFNALFDELST